MCRRRGTGLTGRHVTCRGDDCYFCRAKTRRISVLQLKIGWIKSMVLEGHFLYWLCASVASLHNRLNHSEGSFHPFVLLILQFSIPPAAFQLPGVLNGLHRDAPASRVAGLNPVLVLWMGFLHWLPGQLTAPHSLLAPVWEQITVWLVFISPPVYLSTTPADFTHCWITLEHRTLTLFCCFEGEKSFSWKVLIFGFLPVIYTLNVFSDDGWVRRQLTPVTPRSGGSRFRRRLNKSMNVFSFFPMTDCIKKNLHEHVEFCQNKRAKLPKCQLVIFYLSSVTFSNYSKCLMVYFAAQFQKSTEKKMNPAEGCVSSS